MSELDFSSSSSHWGWMHGHGCESELLVVSLEGERHKTPIGEAAVWQQLPDYRGGNFIALTEAPKKSSMSFCESTFEEVFGASIGHHFAWSISLYGIGSAATQTDYDVERTVFLSTSSPQEPAAPQFETRTLSSDFEWEGAVQTQLHAVAESERDSQMESFFRRRMLRYRELVHREHGNWWGAFAGSELLGSCGVFYQGKEARFQSVVTRDGARQRGVATELVGCVAKQALLRASNVTIAASSGSSAERIYRRLGFEQVDEMGSLLKRLS